MHAVQTGSRIVSMEIQHPIPRTLTIDGFGVKVWYKGQPPKCDICGERHVTSQCPLKGKCRRCREEGHIARNCPSRPWADRSGTDWPISANDPTPAEAQAASRAAVLSTPVVSEGAAAPARVVQSDPVVSLAQSGTVCPPVSVSSVVAGVEDEASASSVSVDEAPQSQSILTVDLRDNQLDELETDSAHPSNSVLCSSPEGSVSKESNENSSIPAQSRNVSEISSLQRVLENISSNSIPQSGNVSSVSIPHENVRNVSSSIPHQSVENVVSVNEQDNLEEGEILEDDLDSCVDSEGFVMPVDPPLDSQGPRPAQRCAGATHHNLPQVPSPRSAPDSQVSFLSTPAPSPTYSSDKVVVLEEGDSPLSQESHPSDFVVPAAPVRESRPSARGPRHRSRSRSQAREAGASGARRSGRSESGSPIGPRHGKRQ